MTGPTSVADLLSDPVLAELIGELRAMAESVVRSIFSRHPSKVLEGPDCKVELDPTVKDRFGLPVARLLPASEAEPNRVPGSAKGLFTVPDDFDAPLEEFREYM